MKTLTEETLTSLLERTAQLQEDLKPFLKALSTKERRKLPKMGDGSVAFVEQAHQYGEVYTELVPAYLDFDGMTEDLALFKQLSSLAQLLNPLASNLNDTMLAAGSNAYTSALAIYRNAKNAKRLNVQSAKVIHDKLAQRFAGIRRNKTPEVIDTASE